MKFAKIIKVSLLFLWLLPQNIIGLLVLLFAKLQGAKSEKYNGALITKWKYSSGVSLGQFIFVSKTAREQTIKHEYGHYLDGTCLGWLYLLIIGLPSIIWASCFWKYRAKKQISYYAFYTEKRADALGEVSR